MQVLTQSPDKRAAMSSVCCEHATAGHSVDRQAIACIARFAEMTGAHRDGGGE